MSISKSDVGHIGKGVTPRSSPQSELIGTKLRTARTARGLTLQAVADSAELTASFISLIERGKAQASVPALLRVCSALQIEIATLFDHPTGAIVEAGHGATLNMGGAGLKEYILTPASEQRFVVMQSIIEPGGGSGGAYSLAAETIFVFMVQGSLELTIDGQVRTLSRGDSTTFPATAQHEWWNRTQRETEVLWTISPALPH